MTAGPQVEIITGGARTRKATTVRQRYLSLIEHGAPDEVLLLVPTSHRRTATVHRLLDEHPLGVLHHHEIWTFPRYANEILRRLGSPVRRVSDFQRQMLLGQALSECRRNGGIRYFEPVAERPGLLGILGGFIHRLKTQEIRPEKFSSLVRSDKGALRETANVYQAYQRLLEENQLYDNAGLFWQVREQLTRAADKFSWPRHVLVDGFQDFTAPELELLAMFIGQAESSTITLPCDASRPDIFRGPLELLSRLTDRLSTCALVKVSQAVAAEVAAQESLLPLIEQRLFAEDGAAVEPSGEDQSLVLAEIPGRTQEVEYIARQLKSMLLEDETLGPQDICVILRGGEPYESLISEIFPRYGLPVAASGTNQLTRVAITAWLCALLELPSNDYPTADLASVLRSPYLAASLFDVEQKVLEQGDIILHQHQVLSGRRAQLSGVESWLMSRRQGQHQDDADGAEDDRLAVAAEFRDLLERFFILLDDLPRKADHRTMVAAVRNLLDKLDLRRTVVGLCDGSEEAVSQLRTELAALNAFDGMLEEWSQAQGWFPDGADELTLGEFVVLLRQAMSQQSLDSSSGSTAAISVLNVFESRALSFDVVVLPGLAQGTWPQPPSSSLLESAGNSQLLESAALAAADRAASIAGERFLFYMAATRAAHKLLVTRPSSDEAGRPIACSPFWDELLRLTGPERVRHIPLSSLATLPSAVANLDEMRRAGLLDTGTEAEQSEKWLAAMLHVDDQLPSMLAGAAVELERESFRPFGRFDGVIGDQQILASLDAAYPGQRLHSISRLQDYLSCPFRFFASSVLSLSAWEHPDSQSLQGLDLGLMYHDILRDFHLQFDEPSADPVLQHYAHQPPAHELMTTVAEKRFDRYERYMGEQLPALWKLQKSEMLDRLLAYVDAELSRRAEAPWRPMRLEWSFGMKHHLDDADDRSTPLPLELSTPYGTVGMRGRIDRIDQAANGTMVDIIDYKSGAGYTNPRREIEKGQSLQMPVYLLAVHKLLLNENPASSIQATYYYLASARFTAGIERHDFEQTKLQELSLGQTISNIFGGIRQGYFPPIADSCPGYCDYRELCRTAGWRVAYKLAADEKEGV